MEACGHADAFGPVVIVLKALGQRSSPRPHPAASEGQGQACTGRLSHLSFRPGLAPVRRPPPQATPKRTGGEGREGADGQRLYAYGVGGGAGRTGPSRALCRHLSSDSGTVGSRPRSRSRAVTGLYAGRWRCALCCFLFKASTRSFLSAYCLEANKAFHQYRDLYFEGGVSSVYLWDLDHGFAGVILIKKAGGGSKKIKGCWESIHVVEVQEKSSGRTAHYKMTCTVMLWLQTNKSGSGTMNLGGSLTRQMEKDETVSDCSPHIANIGRLVEDMENKIRSMLNEIYFGKTKDIVNGLRSVQTFADKSKKKRLRTTW
ncbi:F-actin-capping protein subunit beta-like [Oryctolagus cuniculus]|uniref:F-actin-capping protein subunit beta-like n=1 Tax=Oryctolagus cuniculus TaxID=9986 RepID=UPI003879F7D9